MIHCVWDTDTVLKLELKLIWKLMYENNYTGQDGQLSESINKNEHFS